MGSGIISAMECADVPKGQEFDTDRLIVRWATDPEGRLCLISAEDPELPSPMIEAKEGDGVGNRLLAWGFNRWLENAIGRGERNHVGPPIWFLEVCLPGEHHMVLAEEDVAGRDEARRRVDELVEMVASGALGEGT